MERWRKLGGTVGLKEWDMKGGQNGSENDKVEMMVDEGKEVVKT